MFERPALSNLTTISDKNLLGEWNYLIFHARASSCAEDFLGFKLTKFPLPIGIWSFFAIKLCSDKKFSLDKFVLIIKSFFL